MKGTPTSRVRLESGAESVRRSLRLWSRRHVIENFAVKHVKRAIESQKPRDTRFLSGLHVRGCNVASPDHNLEILQIGAVISKMLTQLDDVIRINHLDYHDPLMLRGTSLRSSMRPARPAKRAYRLGSVAPTGR